MIAQENENINRFRETLLYFIIFLLVSYFSPMSNTNLSKINRNLSLDKTFVIIQEDHAHALLKLMFLFSLVYTTKCDSNP